MTRIVVFPGSVRTGSVNRKLAEAIALRFRDETGVEAEVIDPDDHKLPLYNGDLEKSDGIPAEAMGLAARFTAADAVILVSPEYNASLTPLLKNALDWLSRDVSPHAPFGKPVYALTAASPGGLGGIRGLSHLRDILVSIGADTLSVQLAVGGAGQAFDDAGRLTAERPAGLLEKMVAALLARVRD